GNRLVAHVGVSVPVSLLAPDPEGPETLLGQGSLGLAQRHGVGLRPPALGEIPEPLPVAPTGDRDLAAAVEEFQHPRELRTGAPPDGAVVSAGCVVLELARRQRTAPVQLP